MRLDLDAPDAPFRPALSDTPPPGSAEDDGKGQLASLLKKGISAAQSGDREYARTLLNYAAEIDPDCVEAWMWLASISEYPEELLAHLDRALAVDPGNVRAAEWRLATTSMLAKTFVRRAEAGFRDGARSLALQFVEQALAADAACISAYELIADNADSDDGRRDALNNILSIDPDNAAAAASLSEMDRARTEAVFTAAKTAAVSGNRDLALELLDEYLGLEQMNAEAWVLHSHISVEIGEKLRSLEMALLADPDNAAAKAGHEFLSSTFSAGIRSDESTISSPPEAGPDTDEAPQPDPAATSAVPRPDGASLFDAAPEYRLDEHISDVPHLSAEICVPVVIEATETEIIETPMSNIDTIDSEFSSLLETAVKENSELLVETRSEVVAAPDETPAAPAAVRFTNTGTPNAERLDDDCAFCGAAVESQAFSCAGCGAALSLSEIENILSNRSADTEVIQRAVDEMEAEWDPSQFSAAELSILAVGHLNLKNFDEALRYLQQAAASEPNNVIVAAQANTLAIRLDEMARQSEVRNAMPQGKTILVVDDSPTVRKLISGKLEKSGHTVICAADGVEALERLAENIPDLVLLDITMPRMDGYEVCKQIRQNPVAKDLPVVMISGKDGFFDKVRGRMAGTTGYVTKPFGPETLMKALETYLLPETAAVA